MGSEGLLAEEGWLCFPALHGLVLTPPYPVLTPEGAPCLRRGSPQVCGVLVALCLHPSFVTISC